MTGSRIPGMRSLSPDERLTAVAGARGEDEAALAALKGEDALPLSTADGMIENVIGKFELPLGVATNFIVNGKPYLVPMAVEEPSVVAAASYMAKLAAEHGGFTAEADPPVMRVQIQLLDVADLETARANLLAAREELIAGANACDPLLVELGGGCIDIEVHNFPETAIGPMAVLHLLVDVRDAMGANTVNTMAEAIAPRVAGLANATPRLRILSNLADRRLVRASLEVSPQTLETQEYSGERVARGIVEAWAFADVDPYRAATHNKGIMNGIDPIVVATGNDWRAIEAGAHAFAARSGRYTSLTRWSVRDNGRLRGSIELPMALGLVGGATKTHPAAQGALKLMDVHSASELACVVASVGLAQNMAALRALSTEGIQRGHMALHARNIAIAAGASGTEVDRIARQMADEGKVTSARARELLG